MKKFFKNPATNFEVLSTNEMLMIRGGRCDVKPRPITRDKDILEKDRR